MTTFLMKNVCWMGEGGRAGRQTDLVKGVRLRGPRRPKPQNLVWGVKNGVFDVFGLLGPPARLVWWVRLRVLGDL
jgi:hypothetical protein